MSVCVYVGEGGLGVCGGLGVVRPWLVGSVCVGATGGQKCKHLYSYKFENS